MRVATFTSRTHAGLFFPLLPPDSLSLNAVFYGNPLGNRFADPAP